MDKLNLDISKYAIDELQDIFNVPETTDTNKIQKHMENFTTIILADNNFSIQERENIINFLINSTAKLCSKPLLHLEPSNISKNQLGTQILGTSFDPSETSHPSHSGDAVHSVHQPRPPLHPHTPHYVPPNLTYHAIDNSKNYLVKNAPSEHPLIENPNTLAGQQALISEGRWGGGTGAPPGYINPINIKMIQKTIVIDSRYRANYYNTKSTDFHMNLPNTNKKVTSMIFKAYELPLSLYSITSCNNCFDISGGPGHTKHTIDISHGNYNTPATPLNFALTEQQITTIINDKLQENGYTDLNFNMEQLSGRGYFDISLGSTYDIYFNHDCEGELDLGTPLPLKLGWLLGFRAGQYNFAGPNRLYSEGIVNTQLQRYIYVCINDYTNASYNSFEVLHSESVISPYIIARIPYGELRQDAGSFNLSFADGAFSEVRDYFGPVDIQKLHIQLIDEYGRTLDLNNMDWSFSLTFNLLYS